MLPPTAQLLSEMRAAICSEGFTESDGLEEIAAGDAFQLDRAASVATDDSTRVRIVHPKQSVRTDYSSVSGKGRNRAVMGKHAVG